MKEKLKFFGVIAMVAIVGIIALVTVLGLFATSYETVPIPAIEPVAIERTQEQALSELVGVWEGSYFTRQGEIGLTLSVFEERGIFRAIFNFYSLPGKRNASYGRFCMRVIYNQATGRHSLIAYRWIERPYCHSFVDLEGTLIGDVFSGSSAQRGERWTFRVVRRR